jgi:hypothetical protein
VPLNVPQKKQGILGFLWGVSFLTPHSVEGQVGGKELGLLSWKPVSRAAGVPDKWTYLNGFKPICFFLFYPEFIFYMNFDVG